MSKNFIVLPKFAEYIDCCANWLISKTHRTDHPVNPNWRRRFANGWIIRITCRLIVLSLLVMAVAGCSFQPAADDPFAGSWSGFVIGQGQDSMLAIASAGIWTAGFRLEIDEITIGPRMRLGPGLTGRPLRGTATVHHTLSGRDFEGFDSGTAFLEPETISAVLEGFIETSVHSSTKGEEAWRMELDLASFERTGFIRLMADDRSYTVPIEQSMAYLSISDTGILGTSLVVTFSEDKNTLYLRERISDVSGVLAGHELNGELHRTETKKIKLDQDLDSALDLTTEQHTRLQVTASDQAELIVRPDTKASIQYKELQMILEMERGRIMNRIIGSPITYEVRLPQAVAAVRGTAFIASVRDGVETFIVLEGSVEISLRHGTAPPVILGENQMLVIGRDGSAAAIYDLSPEYPRWWEDVAFTPWQDDGADTGQTSREAAKDIDFTALYNREFRGGQHMEIAYQQLVDGVETTGWMTLEVFEAGSRLEIAYSGMLGDLELSGRQSFEPDADGRYGVYLYFYLLHTHHAFEDMFRIIFFNLLEENFGYLEAVGDRESSMGYVAEARGFDTYAGMEGLTFTLTAANRLIYELCLSPDVPVNLYIYDADLDKESVFTAELVYFRD